MSKIAVDGIYDLSMEEYHSSCCAGPSVSSSGLRALMLECPARFWAFSVLNPKRFPDKSTKALDVGRAAHALVLGEPEFAKYFYLCPHDKLNSNPGKQWNDKWKVEVEAGREKRALIRKDDFDTIQAMVAAHRTSNQVARAYEDGAPERSLIWRDLETGIWLKSRPDWLPHKPAERLTVEYKTARSIEPDDMAWDAFTTYGYDMQAAMIVDGIRAVFGVDPLGVAHDCQEKDPPYLAELRLFKPHQIEDGRIQYRRGLAIFAECWKSKHWPGYTKEPTYFEPPRKHTIKMENMRNEPSGNDGPPDRSHSYNPADYLTAG